jgi:hypothetical protein
MVIKLYGASNVDTSQSSPDGGTDTPFILGRVSLLIKNSLFLDKPFYICGRFENAYWQTKKRKSL